MKNPHVKEVLIELSRLKMGKHSSDKCWSKNFRISCFKKKDLLVKKLREAVTERQLSPDKYFMQVQANLTVQAIVGCT